MNTTTKVILGGCAAVVLIGIVAIIAIGWYVKSHSAGWMEQAKAVGKEGAQYGASASESQCVNETLTRHRNEKSMMGSVKQMMFLRACLDASSAEPEFCSGMPPESELVRSAEWRNSRCSAAGLGGDPTCPNIFSEVQKYCSSDARRKKIEAKSQ